MKRIQLQPSIMIVLLTTACQTACVDKKPPVTKQQVMQEELNERIVLWQAELEGQCQEKVMERATFIVDSTIIANARLERDSNENFTIPSRPEKPVFALPADTTAIRPLLRTKRDTGN